jgi:transcriptional regulator with XRE-family HTH domain
MLCLTFRDRLEHEFAARRAVNARYSLRAFAALLDADHASLSQILRGKRGIPTDCIAIWAVKLKLSVEEAAVYAAVERIASEDERAQSEQLRHWATEMLALLTEPVHREILGLSRAPTFRADSRAIATEIGVDADAVNIALSRLLRLGLLEMTAPGEWRDKTGLIDLTAQSFRQYIADRLPRPLR